MELIIHTKDIDVYRGKNKKKERFLEKIDKKNHFKSRFYIDTGLYKRSGVFDEDGFDTGKDPWMSSMPELIDVGILGHCEHGRTGLCMKSGIECYQNGLGMHQPNMSLENFKRIVDECKGKTDIDISTIRQIDISISTITDIEINHIEIRSEDLDDYRYEIVSNRRAIDVYKD